MRAVLQRVLSAQVMVSGAVVGTIDVGLVVLLGVESGDTDTDTAYIVSKIADLRLFEGDDSIKERSLLETGGSALVVSQFTLLGDCRRGRRPAWSRAARPETAIQYYNAVIRGLTERGIRVATGVFQAHMHLSLVNDGPVTVLLDSKKVF